MKKLLLFFTVLLSDYNLVSAQDYIVKTNADIIKGKVESVEQSEIKYKKFENIDGPVYSVLKKEVYVVVYANGLIDTITNINSAKNNSISSNKTNEQTKTPIVAPSPKEDNTDKYNQYMRAYKRNIGWGIAGTVLCLPVTAAGIAWIASTNNTGYAIAGGVLAGTGVLCGIFGGMDIAKAIKLKKKAQEYKTAINVTPFVYPNMLNTAFSNPSFGMTLNVTF